MKRHVLSIICALVFAGAPASLHAAVVIHEIAWMGTALSASDEWIELYNNGTEAVSLSGWSVKADDGDPSITLSGSIPAGGYFLLERTDDGSVPDIPADKIYSGNLGNTGETLSLRNGTTLIDTVIGGANWQTIGGNNTTKDTAQRQENGTWLTGVPTPKALNTTVDTGGGSSSGTSSSGSSGPSNKPKVSGGYKQNIFAYAGEDMTVTVGADTYFEGFGVDAGNKNVGVAQYAWSFGDGTRGKGKETTHAYREEGVYIVTLTVTSRYQQSKDTVTVTALPASLSITDIAWGEGGYVEIKNEGIHESNLAGWKLFAGERERVKQKDIFTFPEDSIIAAQTSVRFSARDTGVVLTPGMKITLQYPNNENEIGYTAKEHEEKEKDEEILEEPTLPPTETILSEEEVDTEQKVIEEPREDIESTTTPEALSENPILPIVAKAEASTLRGTEGASQIQPLLVIGALCILGLGLFLVHHFFARESERAGNEDELRASDFTIIDTTPKES